MEFIANISVIDVVKFIMYAGMFIALVYLAYNVLDHFRHHVHMRDTLRTLYSQMTDQERARAEVERRQREVHGEVNNKDWLMKLDLMILQSGIRDKLKWLSSEIFMIIVVVTTSIVWIVGIVLHGLLIGFMLGVMNAMLYIVILLVLAYFRGRKVEMGLLQFMNIVDNFSKSSDDIIQIMERTCGYIDDPLSTQIYDAVVEARNTGDASGPLNSLQERVGNRYFQLLIRNLETSSRFETNYSAIIEDCRESFHDYIANEKEKRAIQMNGAIEIIAMVVAGIACITMLGSLSDSGNVFEALANGGPIGQGILVFLIVTMLIALYIVIFQIIGTGK